MYIILAWLEQNQENTDGDMNEVWYFFNGGWAVLVTLDALINWLIKKKIELMFKCSAGVSNYWVIWDS